MAYSRVITEYGPMGYNSEGQNWKKLFLTKF